LDKASNTLPNTPTRITIPASSVFDHPQTASRTHSSSSTPRSLSQEVDEASVEESYIPPMDDGLDDLWETLRHKKEQKMAKETPKVQSLQERPTEEEEFSPLEAPDVDVPVGTQRPDTLRRQKSITSFRESPDGRIIAAFIDMRGVQKQDVHVSYSRNRLVISWKTVEITEYEENGRVIRERLERDFQRVHPLPEGTRFEEISGVMNGRFLVLRYPNSRSFRVENRPSSILS
jgi:HSP20 family molecular chaperone IbpA